MFLCGEEGLTVVVVFESKEGLGCAEKTIGASDENGLVFPKEKVDEEKEEKGVVVEPKPPVPCGLEEG